MFTTNPTNNITQPIAVQTISLKTFGRKNTIAGTDTEGRPFTSILTTNGKKIYGQTFSRINEDQVLVHKIDGLPSFCPDQMTIDMSTNQYRCINNIFKGTHPAMKLISGKIDSRIMLLPQYDASKLTPSDYIDNISADTVTHPAMSEYDSSNRPFVVINVLINGNMYTQTFFQRYTDNTNVWMGASCPLSSDFLYTVGGMKLEQHHLILDLIDGKTVTITKEHFPQNETHIGMTIYSTIKYPTLDFDKLNLPKLNIETRHINSNTDVDFIQPEELIEPAYRGVDNMGTHFLVIKIQVGDEVIPHLFFKTTNDIILCKAIHKKRLISPRYSLRAPHIQLIEDVLLGMTVKMNYANADCCSEKNFGTEIKLFKN